MAPKAGAVFPKDKDSPSVKVPPKRTNDRIYPSRAIPASTGNHIRRVTAGARQGRRIPFRPAMRISEQAFNVLNQIEALPTGPFGPEHQLIIARNLALISGVTADGVEEKREAERKRKGVEESMKRRLRLSFPDWKGGESESEAEDGDGDVGDLRKANKNAPSSRGGGGGGAGGGKRKRDLSDDDDAAKTQALKAKKARIYANPQLQILEPVDIATLLPLPTQIAYPRHPTTDRPDSWFIANFTQLYRQTEAVISHYYSLHEIPLSSEPWLECKMTPEFLKWAEQVVEPNPRFGSWDELLRDREMRKWFVMGMIMKVLKRKVFDRYLFGAGEVEEEMFLQTDRAFLGREGFQREDVRAKLTSTLLGHASVPSLFYPSVAKLTAQISLMLAPLTTYLYSLPPPSSHKAPVPKISALYQSLHNLVSQAAYLSICCKVTPSVIQIHDLRPGDQWHPDDMHDLDTNGYIESKQTILEDFKQQTHNLKSFVAKAKAEMENLLPPLEDGVKTMSCKAAIANYDKYNGILAERLLSPPTYTHRALIKISVWPVIRRYTPGSEEEFNDQSKALREKDGFRIFLLGKGAVVSYFGRDVKIASEYCTLPEWIAVKKQQAEDRLGMLGSCKAAGWKTARIIGQLSAVGVVGAAGWWFDANTGGVLSNGVGREVLEWGFEGVKGLGSELSEKLVSGVGMAFEGRWDTGYQSLMNVAELGAHLKWT